MGIIRETIAKNITKYRKKLPISQKDLADKLGVTQSRISNWEHGTNSPDIEMLFEICKIFKISIDEIYGIEDNTEYLFVRACEYLEDAGYSVYQDEKDLEYDNFQICNENGTVDIMQKQVLINLVESIIKESEEYKEQFIIDKLKRLLSRPNK